MAFSRQLARPRARTHLECHADCTPAQETSAHTQGPRPAGTRLHKGLCTGCQSPGLRVKKIKSQEAPPPNQRLRLRLFISCGEMRVTDVSRAAGKGKSSRSSRDQGVLEEAKEIPWLEGGESALGGLWVNVTEVQGIPGWGDTSQH